MVVSTELTNERGERIRIEVETIVGSDDVDVRIGFKEEFPNRMVGLKMTRDEADALRTCLNDVKND